MIPVPPPRNGPKIDKRYSSVAWKKVREQVNRRDDFTCQACGRTSPAVRLVVDHKIPPDRWTGAFTDLSNLWTLCGGCNPSKADQTVEEWRAAVQRRTGRRDATRLEAARLIPETRPGGRPGTGEAAFLPWALALAAVGGMPADHRHGSRWAVCPTVTTHGQTFGVCPSSCSRPVRWAVG